MGRASFEDALRLGPWAFAGKRVIVLTSRPLIAPPKGVETWRDGIVALAESARKSGDVWLFGGARTTRAFAQAGLIDRYELYLVPELLGDGLRLFESGGLRQGLRLLEARPYPQGVVALVYAARAGD
jgi:dihydrofolate reductase